MATEFKLSYTGSQINEKLSKIDSLAAVSYEKQTLTEAQQEQARKNIGALASDYWTEVERAAIIAEVIDSVKVEYPEAHVIYGDVDANNNITIYGELAKGIYTLKYENTDGTVTDVGTIEVSGENEYTYTNQIHISTDTDGSVFNGTGYKTKSRLGSSGTVSDIADTSASNPVFVTGFIPVKQGYVIRMKNCYIDTDGVSSDTSAEIACYGNVVSAIRIGLYNKGSYSLVSVTAWNTFANWEYITATADSNGYVTEFTVTSDVNALMRFTLAGDPETAILTINEEITD